jgi:hypothetical protein
MTAGIYEPEPLSDEEKRLLTPCLLERGLTPDLLDLMTNVPGRTKLIKVHSPDGGLLGLTNVLVTPSLFMKHCFGPGNHIGTNTTFFFTAKEGRAKVLAAMLEKLVELRAYGHYVGFVDDDLENDFPSGLAGLHHIVADKVLEAGGIEVRGSDASETFLKAHKHLRRHVTHFQKSGGTVHIHEGPMTGGLADGIVDCCLHSYRKNVHPGVPIDISSYGEEIREFLARYPNSVTIYTEVAGQITGVQIFLRHPRHLELTEGGFAPQTFRAYENIILASVRYCQEHGLDRVNYGLILNETKDRLMDLEKRKPIFLVMLFRDPPGPDAYENYRNRAHERFGRLMWKDRSHFTHLAL